MPAVPTFLMVDPAHYTVSYAINPWMAPATWARDAAAHHRAAVCAWQTLGGTLGATGAEVVTAPGAPGLPDMVFPANAAVVLDRRALLARFRHPERRGEEPLFARAFDDLREQLPVDRGPKTSKWEILSKGEQQGAERDGPILTS